VNSSHIALLIRSNFRLYDWLRSSTGSTAFEVEVFGSFLLRDNDTKELSWSHGHRAIKHSTLNLGDGIKTDPDHVLKLTSSLDVKKIARGLISGSATAHFEQIFERSSRSVIGLLQITLCCDSFNRGPWLQKYVSAKMYDTASG